VQTNVLERYPDADLRVYTVWVPALPTDERFAVDQLLDDDRVRSFWDADGAVARWVANARLGSYQPGGFAYDVYFLYGPTAEWTRKPEPTLSSGAPVVFEGQRLLDALKPLVRP